ncbi:aspartate kinase [Chloroherpeton thalassium ATCC 35110]|uniref:Aspartokinase n=1 Tax=Chloroherpeton thalassium (strain ATCC 35110 / GB-78) TaxID=517418 RepID=B3QZB7_CHLT3|nr:lysine-sensitive aspartokinase 3 [Chloroherpeton thalassium]ACF13810.1 aspartate kinase [Chloroherpeton thalassium ATCC 35110]
MPVMKFGGTSVADAAAMENVINIIRGEIKETAPLVVSSACSGITNKLVALAHDAAEETCPEAFSLSNEIKTHHQTVIDDLIQTESLRKSLHELVNKYTDEINTLIKGVDIVGELTPRTLDAFYSYGELFSTNILAAAMQERGIKTEWLDARQVLITDDNFGQAQPLWDITQENLNTVVLPKLEAGIVVVTQGFIGSNRAGKTTTLGRGGSDYSAAIFGALLNRASIQIWTDVDGVLTCDPRMVPEAKRLKVMTFSEAAELSYFGAKVLHPSTIHPAVKNNVPVYVKNSKRPESEGTLITNDPELLKGMTVSGMVKSIAYKKAQSIINVRSTNMLGTYGFLADVFRVFADNETSVDMISTSEVSVSLTISNTKNLNQIIEDLKHYAEVDVEHNAAIVCVVGDKLRSSAGVAGRIFNAMHGVNIRMISQGASEINVGFVISEKDLEKAVKALHNEFFSEVSGSDVFA